MEISENARLFTVKNFASQVGITSSAVYQQLNGRLKPYAKKGKGGQVYITAEALQLYDNKPRQTVDKASEALTSENEALKATVDNLKAENARLSGELDHLREQLAREQELSRERLTRLEAADRRIDSLLEKIPPMLPAGNAGGGGLFGWLKRKKGDTTK